MTRRILLYVFSLLFCLPWLHAQVDDLQAEDADTVSVTFRRLEFHTPIFLSQSERYDLRKGLQSEFAELSKQQWPESLKYTAAELARAWRRLTARYWLRRGRNYEAILTIRKKQTIFLTRFFKSPLNGVIPEDYVIRHVDEVDRSLSYALQLLPSLRH